MFQPSSANIRVELCRLYSMFGVMTPRGKTYRYSPLCSQQAVDSVSENDKEVEQSFPKVSVRVAKEAHMERMIALHRTKDWKQVCLQLSPRTSLISFIWSVFVSDLPMILQRWNKSQMYLWWAKNICSVLFFMHFLAWNAKLNRISRSSQVKSSLFRQGGPISHRLVSKGALCKIKITWNKFKNLEITLKLCTRSLKIWVNVNNISMKYNFPRSIQFKEKQLKHVQVLY